MDFFKQDDCEWDLQYALSGGPFDPKVGDYMHKKISDGMSPMISIDKANRLLMERGQAIVFNFGTLPPRPLAIASAICSPCHPMDIDEELPRTHQALLINIEPIEKPDTAEDILKYIVNTWSFAGTNKAEAISRIVDRARKLIGESK